MKCEILNAVADRIILFWANGHLRLKDLLIFKESKIRVFQFSGISQVLWFSYMVLPSHPLVMKMGYNFVTVLS